MCEVKNTIMFADDNKNIIDWDVVKKEQWELMMLTLEKFNWQ
jgi:hypothetical protein